MSTGSRSYYPGDDLVISDTFGSTSTTLNTDHTDGTDDGWDPAGNLIIDEFFIYTYDAWHRMVNVSSKQDSDVTIQTASHDGLGRRIKKVVGNSGDLDGTFTHYYDALHRIIEARDGSDNLVTQVYCGTQYIDEVVSMKTDHGYMIVNQDANWNVVAATDLAGTILERVYYTPYGQPTFNSETFFGDYGERSERERAAIGKADMDVRVRPATCPQGASTKRATEGGDGDVDATDDGNLGNGQACWGADPSGACRVFDFDQDGDLDNDDQTTMTALVNLASTNHVHNSRISSSVGLIFAHQGLILDPEISQSYNRARTYNPELQRFVQRDPFGLRLGVDMLGDYRDGMNLYGYLRASPIAKVDPFGMIGNQCRSAEDCRRIHGPCKTHYICKCGYCQCAVLPRPRLGGTPQIASTVPLLITKEMIRRACAGKFRRAICERLAKEFRGRSCNQLERRCFHLIRHTIPGNNKLAEACWLTFNTICSGR